MMSNLVGSFALSGFANAVFALSFGLIVIFKNWRERPNQLFFAMTTATAIWAFSYWRWLSANEHQSALFWVRLLSVGSLFIPVFYFHWIALFLRQEKRLKSLLRIMYALALMLLFFAFSPLFIKDVSPRLFFRFWPDPGALYLPYLIAVYAGLVSLALALLLRAYRSATAEVKGQIFYIVLGTLFGFIGGATNFFLWYRIPILPYGNFAVAFFPFFLGYSVLKHHLFQLKVVATELLVFSIWLFLLVRSLVAETAGDRFLDLGLLALVVFFGIFLIQSVLQEVRSREHIQELAAQLTAANAELKRLDEAKSEFISIASHQLRAPLTVIKGYVSMLIEGTLGPIAPLARESMAKVATSAEQLVHLVADLLDLSRIESGRLKYDFKPVLMDDVVSQVVGELDAVAKAKGLFLFYETRNEAKRRVEADAEKLHEVVINLIDNAIKYTATGRISVEFYPETVDGRAWLTLKVRDNGIGIKAGDVARMFTKFTRTEEARRIRPDGLGLGLYLVKKIIDDHGGRAWVESPGLEQGSTFYVSLPTVA